MAGYLADDVFDNGLSFIVTNGNKLDICTQQPATYAEISTFTKGNKTGITIDAPIDRVGGGREITIEAITDGNCTGNGIATHWAISNGTDKLIASNMLDAQFTAVTGALLSLQSFTIAIPDPI